MLLEGPTPDEAEAVDAHFDYLARGVDDGRVLLAGRTTEADDRAFGICIFRARDREAAQAFVDADPAVAAGVMRAELFAYRVALLARSWPSESPGAP